MKSRQGFTIVELIIVVIVIAILAVLAILSYSGVQVLARQSRLASETQSIGQKIEVYRAENDAYPSSITDCPTPASANICISPSDGETYSYRAISPSGAGTYIMYLNSAYELQIMNGNTGAYTSNAEITNGMSREFMQYTDLAPLIDACGLVKYKLSFDIKSADTSSKSVVQVNVFSDYLI